MAGCNLQKIRFRNIEMLQPPAQTPRYEDRAVPDLPALNHRSGDLMEKLKPVLVVLALTFGVLFFASSARATPPPPSGRILTGHSLAKLGPDVLDIMRTRGIR
jgi:hypothetical protein